MDRNSWPGALVGAVYLDGELLTNVMAFDVAEGWVDQTRIDDMGKTVWQDDGLVLDRRKGAVTFAWRDESSAQAARRYLKAERITQAQGEISPEEEA